MAKEKTPSGPVKADATAKGAGAPTPGALAGPRPPVPLRGWRDLWQLPALLIGAALLVVGVSTLVKRAPGPDFAGALETVERLLVAQRYDDALKMLNDTIAPSLGEPGTSAEVRGRFHALRADALYLAQRSDRRLTEGKAGDANNQRTLEEYELAEQLDKGLIAPRREAFIAETLLDLGRVDAALERIRKLTGDEEGDRRRRLLRRVIGDLMAGRSRSKETPAQLLEFYERDPTLSADDRLWAVLREGWSRLAAGQAERVIDDLLGEAQRLDRRDSREAAELFLLLGRAYLEKGEIEAAKPHLARAEAMLGAGEELRGQVDVLLARIAQEQGDLEEARDRFVTVVERFPGTEGQLQALLGLGEVEADLARYPESLQAYDRLIRALQKSGGTDGGGVTIEVAAASMSQRQRVRESAGDLDTALAYARLVVSAYPVGRAPPEVLLTLADNYRTLGLQRLKGGASHGSDEEGRGVDEVAAGQAGALLASAAEVYQQHARAAMVGDPERAAQSMWNAADCFDMAGRQDRAIKLFSDFVQARRNDPRQLEAKYRLARCFQAQGQYPTAISLFEAIIQGSPGSDEAYRSYVPLSQCALQRGQEGDPAKAEAWLLKVLDGRMFEPASPEFRRALVELGRMYLRAGRFPEAIKRLDEALQRYPKSPEATQLRFDLAEADRLSSAQIEKQLQGAMPTGERAELEKIRVERLRSAMGLYEEVRTALEADEHLTEFDATVLRNAFFYRGDCAFDLGEYDTAIRFYDAAAQRFSGDPGSLVAMVQIVNCYAAQGKWREAKTAHERAQTRLRELPEDAWERARAPMDRRHWERWLEATMRLDQMEARARADTGG